MKLSLDRLLFVDLEASGLHATSFPIEFGWCDINLRSGSFLIRPHESWTERDWNPLAERLHGITLDKCRNDGLPVSDAARFFNEHAGGCVLVSDNPNYDGGWLARLRAAAPSLHEPRILHLEQVVLGAMDDAGMSMDGWLALRSEIGAGFPHLHRAAADALRMAALVRAIYDPEFVRDFMRRPSGPIVIAPAFSELCPNS